MRDLDLILLESVPSTNTYAKEHIDSLTFPSLIIAKGQTAGRGRQGKSFFSPENSGLYMTLVFPAPQKCDLLTPAAAVAVCNSLEKHGVIPKIKWVNDIFVNDLKTCGILTECFTNQNNSFIALGIGINLTTSKFPDNLKIAGSAGIECDKIALAREISESILDYSENLNDKYILREYRKRLFVIGKQIFYSKNNQKYSAYVKDINEQCNLIVERTDGYTDTLSSGEISIKL